MNKRFLFFVNFFTFSLSAASLDIVGKLNAEAMVIVNVADLTEKPLVLVESGQSAEELHANFGVSPEKGPDSCARERQLLFNERVRISSKHNNEVECELFHLFNEGANKTKNNKFWTLAKNLRLLESVKDLNAIPGSFVSGGKINHENIATLIMPWEDPKTKICYSAGTRFCRIPTADTEQNLAIQIINHESNQTSIAFVPKNIVIATMPDSPKQAQAVFVDVLKNWAASSETFIPYVWGGCSFVNYCNDNVNAFSIVKKGPIEFWTRTQNIRPFCGFDCSGLVLRAAQIAGMPYYFENTTTLANNLKKLSESDHLNEGDLIFFPRHVMVVSDIEKNKLIEARGYGAGFGKVLTQKLGDVFKNISNYKELLDAYFSKSPVKLLSKDKNVIREIPEITIYRLSSIYDAV